MNKLYYECMIRIYAAAKRETIKNSTEYYYWYELWYKALIKLEFGP
jgi:hypothetical protein